jgi:hypothetical protein
MRIFLTAFFCLLLNGMAFSAPPDPTSGDIEARDEEAESAEVVDTFMVPETIEKTLEELEGYEGIDTNTLKDLENKLMRLKAKYEGMGKVLEGIDEGYSIEELILGGDSIYIRLINDSSFTFKYSDKLHGITAPDKDILRFGGTFTVEEDQVIEGDVVSAFGDVIVKGTVEGGVIAFSGDIYLTSTGNVEGGVFALSGRVKRETGSEVETVIWGSRNVRANIEENERYVFRVMGMIFFMIFVIWMILSATCASLMKSNVNTVIRYIKDDGAIKSYFLGYLAYLLAFLVFVGLCITVLGLPLALLGVPLALLAALILSSTAISNLIGLKALNAEKYSFKTFFYGNLFLGLIPGLMFLVQLITGNLVFMVFSWIFIGIFIFIILPVGLGAVLSTRFGTRLKKATPSGPAPGYSP